MRIWDAQEYSWVDAKRALPRLTWEIELYGPSIRPKANHHTKDHYQIYVHFWGVKHVSTKHSSPNTCSVEIVL